MNRSGNDKIVDIKSRGGNRVLTPQQNAQLEELQKNPVAREFASLHARIELLTNVVERQSMEMSEIALKYNALTAFLSAVGILCMGRDKDGNPVNSASDGVGIFGQLKLFIDLTPDESLDCRLSDLENALVNVYDSFDHAPTFGELVGAEMAKASFLNMMESQVRSGELSFKDALDAIDSFNTAASSDYHVIPSSSFPFVKDYLNENPDNLSDEERDELAASLGLTKKEAVEVTDEGVDNIGENE